MELEKDRFLTGDNEMIGKCKKNSVDIYQNRYKPYLYERLRLYSGMNIHQASMKLNIPYSSLHKFLCQLEEIGLVEFRNEIVKNRLNRIFIILCNEIDLKLVRDSEVKNGKNI